MTKKHFIALADAIRYYNTTAENDNKTTARPFTEPQLWMLASFCAEQNERFNRSRWLGYVAGTNGKNGGKVK